MRLAFRLSTSLSAVLVIAGAEPKLKPRHDPAEQIFRRAPMAESARSIVVNLATNLHYAFDPDLARVHTIWQGGPVNLWGPPYSYAKSPFICDFTGTVLFSFPQVDPWWSNKELLRTRFRAIDTEAGEAALSYDLLAGPISIPVIERLRGFIQNDNWTVQRTLAFPQGTPQELDYLAFAESGASLQRSTDSIQVTSTNGTFTLSAGPLVWEVAAEKVAYETLRITEEATEKGFNPIKVSGDEMRAYLRIPAREGAFDVTLTLSRGKPQHVAQRAQAPTPKTYSASDDLRARTGDEFYQVEPFPLPPAAELLITGMDWLGDRDLAVCTWLGDIYFVHNAIGDVRKATYRKYASGLSEPLGLAVRDGALFVVQKGELTKVSDGNGDGIADRFETINSSWGYSGNYHSYSFGPLITAENDFIVFITGQRGLDELPFQGWGLEINQKGDQVTPFCSGLRVPHGWGFYGPDRDIFVTDNQGNWIGACRLNHLQKGKFYGFPSSTPAPKGSRSASEVEPPILWFPRSLSPSSSGFTTIQDNRFGPFSGQLLIGDFQNSIVMRAFLEKVNGRWQGAVFPFAKGFLSGVNRLSMGPDGKLYVGGGKRTWSTAAPKEFSLERVAFTGKSPFEVKEVHATRDGFELTFTKELDASGSDPANYLVKQFTYRYHKEYGSPEFDHSGQIGATELAVTKAQLLAGSQSVRLQIPNLRTGFVTSFQIAVTSAEDQDLRSDMFYYTLNEKPALQ